MGFRLLINVTKLGFRIINVKNWNLELSMYKIGIYSYHCKNLGFRIINVKNWDL